MTRIAIPGMGALYPFNPGVFNSITSGFASITLNTTDGVVAFIGRVWWPDATVTSKNLRTIGFRAGGVTFGGASVYKVSVQNVSTSAGPPAQPDGVVDQSFISAAGTGPTPNVWNTVTLSADRTVARGDLIAICFSYDTFTAADSIVLQNVARIASNLSPIQHTTSQFTGAWAEASSGPNVILGFSDSSFGAFFGGYGLTTHNSRSFNSGTTGSGGFGTGDERCLEITPTEAVYANGCWIDINVASGGDFDIVLYEGTTVRETISIDANAIAAAGVIRRSYFPFSAEWKLTEGVLWRLAVKPTTTNNVTINSATLNDAGHRVIYGGTDFASNSRTDGGSFGTASTVEIPMMGFVLSAYEGGSGILMLGD